MGSTEVQNSLGSYIFVRACLLMFYESTEGREIIIIFIHKGRWQKIIQIMLFASIRRNLFMSRYQKQLKPFFPFGQH